MTIVVAVGGWQIRQQLAQPRVLPTQAQLPPTAVAQQPTDTTVPPTPAPSNTPTTAASPTTDVPNTDVPPSATITNTTEPTATATATVPPTTEPNTVTPVPPTAVTLNQEQLLQPVDDTLIIRFNEDTTAQERAEYIVSIGASVEQEIEQANAVVVKVEDTNAVTANAIVADAEPDYYVQAQDLPIPPNDPGYNQQWALPAIGYATRWFTLPDNPQTVRVAVIDSGVCSSHTEFDGRLLSGYDYVENDSVPNDEYGHGCSVTGVIAANVNNGVGVAGAAPNTEIIPLRVLGSTGGGTYSDVASAIYEAVDRNADIINLSLGGAYPSSILGAAIDYAEANGVLVVAAAGNAGAETVIYPAAYPYVVAVGSVDSDGGDSSFSNYGAGVDLKAPGGSIYTTANSNGYTTISGTSFASPYAAAVAALQMASGQPVLQEPILLWETEDDINDIYDNALPAENTNLLKNGGFGWNIPTKNWKGNNHMASLSVVNGKMQARRANTSTSRAWLIQKVNETVPPGSPFELSFALSKSNSTAKQVQIVLRGLDSNGNGAENAIKCTVDVTQTERTFTLRGVSGVQWDQIQARVDIIDSDMSTTIVVDDADLRYLPSSNISGKECLAEGETVEPPPANENLVKNGGFGWNDPTNKWERNGKMASLSVVDGKMQARRSDPNGNSAWLYQTINETAPPGSPFELSFKLSKSNSTDKQVQIVLSGRDSAGKNAESAIKCDVPLTQTEQTFTLQGISTTNWASIQVRVDIADSDTATTISVDDAQLRYLPNSGITSNSCNLPNPDPNFVGNSTFDSGTSGWFSNSNNLANLSVNGDGALAMRRNNADGNSAWIAHNVDVALNAGSPVEYEIQLAHNGAGSKQVELILRGLNSNNRNAEGGINCTVNVTGTPQTFTVRAESTVDWAKMQVRVALPGSDNDTSTTVAVDNVSLMHMPDLNVSPNPACPPSGVPAFGDQFLALLNAERAANGAGPVSYNNKLTSASQKHTQDMVDRGFFSHTAPEPAPNGAGIGQRISNEGYNWFCVAENIAGGQTSETAVFNAWMNSGGHRANMLNPAYDEIGLARVNNIWTLDLGNRTYSECVANQAEAVGVASLMRATEVVTEAATVAVTVEATQEATVEATPVPPVVLPVAVSMDDGAPLWMPLGDGTWTLTPDAAVNESALGWQAIGSQTAALLWEQPLDLTAAANPQMTVASNLAATSASAAIQVQSVDGGEWLTPAVLLPTDGWQTETVDLSAFAGQTISVRFIWIGGPDEADRWFVDDVAVFEAAIPATEEATQMVTEVVTESATVAVTDTVTEVATELVTEEATSAPTDAATELATEAIIITEAATAVVTEIVTEDAVATSVVTEVITEEAATEAVATEEAVITEAATTEEALADPMEAATTAPTATDLPTETPLPTQTATDLPTETPLPTQTASDVLTEEPPAATEAVSE